MAHTYEIGSVVPSTFDPLIVMASYFASLCGTFLTIELLNRRATALGSLRSWLESLSCAVAFGLVGIWCMHFIGNRAIVLGDGSSAIQLTYNSGFTTLSVFCPVIGLLAAFSAAEVPTQSKTAHRMILALTGLLAAASIAGMHYIGNLGIANYSLSYSPRFLAASIIISVGDCELVLVLFYTLREKWISSWWKRLLCALLLAGGVSAMHFTASTHCTYTLKQFNGPENIHGRDVQVIIAGSICGAAALSSLGVLLLVHLRSREIKQRSQKVTLACVIFSPDGQILVTTDGVLPSREITDQYNHRTFDEDFDTAHKVFQWIFRVTYSWASVSSLVPRMQRHLGQSKDLASLGARNYASRASSMWDGEGFVKYEVMFRERFCIAAASLASSMNLPLERLGVLYDRIVETGTIPSDDYIKRGGSVQITDVEAPYPELVFGKGQVMFITRQAKKEDIDGFLNAGYRFASTPAVKSQLAQAMQVPIPTIETHLHEIKQYVDNLNYVDKAGTWLTLFAMLPNPNHKGFSVAVNKDCQNQLPDVQLLPHHPEPWQHTLLSRMDGCRVGTCLTFLDDHLEKLTSRIGSDEVHFVASLRKAIIQLLEKFPSEWTHDARFCSEKLEAPYSRAPSGQPCSTTTLYAFTVITDLHTNPDTSKPIARVPLSFFKLRQRCYPGSRDQSVLASEVLHEFGPLLARKAFQHRHTKSKMLSISPIATDKERLSSVPYHDGAAANHGGSTRTSAENVWSDDGNSSQYEMIEKPSSSTSASAAYQSSSGTGTGGVRSSTASTQPAADHTWGGILVSRQTVIETDAGSPIYQSQLSSTGPKAALNKSLGTKVEVGLMQPGRTFADQLVDIAKERNVPAKPDSPTLDLDYDDLGPTMSKSQSAGSL